MRLKRLELQGYKTFAAKTEFTFEDGITAIVGPNGSGKSNIADAIRWVLGERSYSVLRAKRTEDMIFWGSERRSRQGMAQASITLDNHDGDLPVDYSEITISRRAYRSGENEYLLNGRRVRLKDITELLDKGGLGRRTYNVIGQGLVDAVLSLRPDERRAIFEDAAGISVHRSKRTDAINKLEQTRDNILRVNDLVNEIAPRLARLERQAERAQHYQELSQQLEEDLLTWYAHRWQRAQAAMRQAKAQAAERQELSREREAELEELELRKAELRAQQGRLRQKLSDLHLMKNDLQAQSEGKKRELAVSEERLRLLNQQSEDIAQEIASLETNRLAQLERVAEAQEELDRAEAQLQERLINLPETQEQLQARKGERQAVQRQLTTVQDRAFQLATEAADRRNRLTQLSERREELDQEVEEHRKALAEHQTKITTLREQIETLRGELEALGAEADSLALRRQEIEQESKASRKRLAEFQDALSKIRQEETGLQARYDLLERMRHEESGYSAGADTVLQAARDGRLRGIVGPVARLIRVPAESETAIEAALGPHLHDIVTETLDDAKAAIQFLKRTRGGRATFLPLDRISGTKTSLRIADIEGVIGLAVDSTKFEQRLTKVGHYLLGNTIVVRDLDTALRLLARTGPAKPLQIAALTGEVVSSHGVVTGGPARGRGGGILAREREWRELPQHLAEVQKARSDLEHKHQIEEANQRRLLEKLTTLEETESAIKARKGAKQEELASQERQADLLEQEIGWRQAIESQLKAEVKALDEKELLFTEELEGLKEGETQAQQQILALKAQLDSLGVEELEDRLARARTSIAVAKQAREDQLAVLQDLKARLVRSDEQISAKKEKQRLLTAENLDLVKRIEYLQLDSQEMTHQVQVLAQLVEPSEAELSALESEQVELETAEARLRPQLREYESLQGQAALKVERRKDELANLSLQIENDLGCSLADFTLRAAEVLKTGAPEPSVMEIGDHASPVTPDEEPPELADEIGRLRAQLKHIGPVNPNAPAEYEEVMERYKFLTAQAGDLEEAAEDLRQVIGELDELMKRALKETFEAVRKEFKKYFTSLFNGGAAELVLTEPNDLMETGIDIIARPPGRREQRLTLLSGGERALTAVALIFAILKTSPTPFCFLDEVDATLDESNVGRFREALQELSEHTQFIIITHNRRTVEAADTIYGVSMGEDSISRVISLKLAERRNRESK